MSTFWFILLGWFLWCFLNLFVLIYFMDYETDMGINDHSEQSTFTWFIMEEILLAIIAYGISYLIIY